jgi:RNA polymerase sigma factor (TIGR02999 family)
MENAPSNSAVTQLLIKWRAGDRQALNDLIPLVYDELCRLAAGFMRDENRGHTLQPTALVHEAYLRLTEMDPAWQNRAHFFAVAARLMRRILVDHARTKQRMKRGGPGALKVTLNENLRLSSGQNADILALDEAIEKLSRLDERKARIVELHYFGGLTYDETAKALQISAATVDRDLRFAKAWLFRELGVKGGTNDT